MKKIVFLLAVVTACNTAFAQNASDTNFVTIITSVSWVPDGQSMLLNIVKFDKTRKTPPAFKTFTYTLSDKKLTSVAIPGNTPSVSPNGKSMVLAKPKENNKADIYLYDIATKTEMPLVVDTFYKSSPGWSPDGQRVVYSRESNGRGRFSTIDICIVDLATRTSTQITQSAPHKAYNPIWAPEGDKIVYYFEKGDYRDQIWLTDVKGSFHTNLTNDTSTHNYFPSWIDKNTIVYTQSPNFIMTMKPDGSNRKKVEGIESFSIRYNAATKKVAYVTQQPDSKLVLFDWEKGTSVVLLGPDDVKKLL
jgi:Tol biopolymer transport system component